MATFASVWAIRCDTPRVEGENVTVTTKAGKRKELKIGHFVGTEKTKYDGLSYLYLPLDMEG